MRDCVLRRLVTNRLVGANLSRGVPSLSRTIIRGASTASSPTPQGSLGDGIFSPSGDDTDEGLVVAGCAVHPNFITEEEETAFLAAIQPLVARRRFEKAHWDAVIEGFREMQISFQSLSPVLESVVARVAAAVPPAEGDVSGAPAPLLPFLHVLDLASDGAIRHHVDSVKFSGGLVAGLCLMSDAVMSLRPDLAGDGRRASSDGSGGGASAVGGQATGGSYSMEGRSSEKGADSQQANPSPSGVSDAEVRVFLPRRCFYTLTGPARYEWGHAILPGPQEVGGRVVTKGRRISLMFRDPLPSDLARAA